MSAAYIYIYITVLTNRDYLPGVWVLKKSLESVATKYPLCVLIPEEREAELSPILTQWGLKVLTMPNIQVENAGNHYWKETFFKLQCSGLTEFEKIVLIDSDMIVLRNLDHLFDYPHMSAVASGKFMVPSWTGLNSGLIVLTPSEALNATLKSSIDATIHEQNAKGLATGDQDVFKYVFSDWPEREELHLPEEYNVMNDLLVPLCRRELKNGIDDIYIVHYTGKKKPWTYGIKEYVGLIRRMFIQKSTLELAVLLRYKAYLRLRPHKKT